MHPLPAFKGAARQRGIGGIDKNVRTCCEKGSFEFGETGPPDWIEVLDDVSRRENVKVAIKRHAVKITKKTDKKSMNRAPAGKTACCKQTVTGSRLTAYKKKTVLADLL